VLEELAAQVEGEDWFEVFDAGESAEVVGLEVFRQAFDAELAFGLQAAELAGRAVEIAMGLGAGAVGCKGGILATGRDAAE